jgi:hypothetical protein
MDLAKSPFRRRFRLGRQELRYLEQKGLRAVLDEGANFLSKRLAAASPPNDGKQTPLIRLIVRPLNGVGEPGQLRWNSSALLSTTNCNQGN